MIGSTIAGSDATNIMNIVAIWSGSSSTTMIIMTNIEYKIMEARLNKIVASEWVVICLSLQVICRPEEIRDKCNVLNAIADRMILVRVIMQSAISIHAMMALYTTVGGDCTSDEHISSVGTMNMLDIVAITAANSQWK